MSLGGGVVGFLLFRVEVHTGKFLSADSHALSDFYLILHPRIQYNSLVVNS